MTRWYLGFCTAVTPDTLCTLAVYGASLHPLYVGIESNPESLDLLQRRLRPHAVSFEHIRTGIALLREGMRHTLNAPIPANLVELAREPRVRAFMRAYHGFAALRFQKRMRAQPELLSATVRVLMQGPFFTARVAHRPLERCQRLPFFTGHSFYDLFMRVDVRVLPSVFPERYPDFMDELHNARMERDDDAYHDPLLSHRALLHTRAPIELDGDIDAAVQFGLLFSNNNTTPPHTDAVYYYEPHGLSLRSELADALAFLRADHAASA